MNKDRLGMALLVFSLLFLFDCKRTDIEPTFNVLVRQCDNPTLVRWPSDLSVDIYYFPPETNMDDAFDEVNRERYSPSETVELKPSDFGQDGSFTLQLKRSQVVVLLLYEMGIQNSVAHAELETTHGNSAELCLEYNP